MSRKTYPPAPKRPPAKPLEPKSFAPPESKWQWVFFGSFGLMLVMLVIVVAVGCSYGYHNHKLERCEGSNEDITNSVRHHHGDGLRPGSAHYYDHHDTDNYCIDDGIVREK